MQFTGFEVRRTIRILYDSGQSLVDVHAEQDEVLLQENAFTIGNPPGCEVIHDPDAGTGALVPSDHPLTEHHFSLGYFGGLEWAVIGISDQGEFQLSTGNDRNLIDEICAALQALLSKS